MKVSFEYTDAKGKTRQRIVIPFGLSFGGTHNTQGNGGDSEKPKTWLMMAWDVERQAMRTFTLSRINYGTWEELGLPTAEDCPIPIPHLEIQKTTYSKNAIEEPAKPQTTHRKPPPIPNR